MLRKFFVIMGIIGIFMAGAAIIFVMGQLAPKPNVQKSEPAPPSVFFQIAEPQSLTIDVNVQGEVRPRTDIQLTAQVAGRIASVSDAFVDGGAFEKGDMLVKIEDADYRLALTRTQARVAQAEQALKQEQAESDLARRDWEELGDGSPPSDLTLRKPQLAQARADFDAAKADYDEAKLNLNRTTVRAPFIGRVRNRAVGVGQFISPGAELGRIFSTDVAEVRFPLTDANLATLGLPFAFIESPQNPGPKVIMSAAIGGDVHEWVGRLARTEGSIDPTTRQIGAIAVVDDPYGAGSDDGVPLAIGLFVDAMITGQPYDNAFVLPLGALYGRDTMYVIADNNTLEKRTVRVATSSSTEVIVISGLIAGDRVAVSPLRGGGEGDEVTPVDPTATPSAPRKRSTPEDVGKKEVNDDTATAGETSSNTVQSADKG